MKYCENYAALLDLFADGELPPEEMERVRAHLETCPGCRAYVDDALAMRAAFPDVEETPVPEGFAESVMERIRRDEGNSGKIAELRRQPARRWVKTLAGLAACCALVILVGTTGWGRSETARMVTGTGAAADTEAAEERAVCEESGDEILAGPEEETFLAMDEAEKERATTKAAAEETRGKTESGAAAGADSLEPGAAASPASTENTVYTVSDEAASASIAGIAGEDMLYLTAEEAGALLDRFTPVWEDAVSARYDLDAGEYRALLEALGRQAEIQGTEERTFSVVVERALE